MPETRDFRKLGFLLTPDFPIATLSTALEPLRIANEILQQESYHWSLLSIDNKTVRSSCGIAIAPDVEAKDLTAFDLLFVVGGVALTRDKSPQLQRLLRLADRRGLGVGAISGGVFPLARSGLLDGRDCAVHWYYRNAFRELFPKVTVSARLFEIEPDRITCAGGTGSLDMMLSLMSAGQDKQLLHEISAWLHYPEVRGPLGEQGGADLGPFGISQPQVAEAIAIFRQNVEAPLPIAKVAERIGISNRQLERLFLRQFSATPSAVYRQIRLLQARELIQHTGMSMTEVALATGFQAYGHFSRRYRQLFGVRPGHSGAQRPSGNRQRESNEAKFARSAGAKLTQHLPAEPQ